MLWCPFSFYFFIFRRSYPNVFLSVHFIIGYSIDNKVRSLCLSLFLKTFVGLQNCNFIKTRLRHSLARKINQQLKRCTWSNFRSTVSEVYLGPCQAAVMLCAIWHRLYNLKNVKSTHVAILLLAKVSLHHGFHVF